MKAARLKGRLARQPPSLSLGGQGGSRKTRFSTCRAARQAVWQIDPTDATERLVCAGRRARIQTEDDGRGEKRPIPQCLHERGASHVACHDGSYTVSRACTPRLKARRQGRSSLVTGCVGLNRSGRESRA